ncbi:MAG: hypothetical protein DRH04_06155 [Deltaproteobacteria bacterium]|nr:MAG: hypothetical protein DRH04_06155 [Deltaproteobacteria bacterium]
MKKTRFFVLLLAAAFIFCFYASPGISATIRVPKDKATIQAAIKAASPGDTVLVADGSYSGPGNINLDFLGKSITVRSENGPGKCLINCQDEGRAFDFHSGESSHSILSGFTIKNGYDEKIGGGIYIHKKSNPTISNCVIRSCASGGNGGALAIYTDSYPTINDCIIENNDAVRRGGAIFVYYTGPSINRCIIRNNQTIGFIVDEETAEKEEVTLADGGGIYSYCEGYETFLKQNLTITNCLFYGNDAAGLGGAISLNHSPALIMNCTIADNQADDGGSGINIEYKEDIKIINSIINLNKGNDINFHLCSASAYISHSFLPYFISVRMTGENNSFKDPLFVNRYKHDYHLAANSPCIDFGTGEGAPADDLEGKSRSPKGIDVGAYEYGIFVNQPPVVTSFAADHTSGETPLQVHFTCKAGDKDGTITSYTIDFGDGSEESNTTGIFSNVYDTSGTFLTHCTVTDDRGAQDTSKTLPIRVVWSSQANQNPLVTSFTATPSTGEAPLDVSFTCEAEDVDGSVTGYTWNYGDGHQETGAMGKSRHIYEAAGVYTATCTVVDDEGGTSVSQPVQVTATGKTGYNVYFLHVASNNSWHTEICVVNTGSEPLSGTFQPYDNGGQPVSAAITVANLAPHGRRQIIVGQEFENAGDIAYIVFTSDRDETAGYIKFFSADNRSRVAVPAARESNHQELYLPHIASGDSWWTGISLVNTTRETKTVSLDFDNGSSKSITLGPGAHYAKTIRDILSGGLLGETPQIGDIHSATMHHCDGVLGLELFGRLDLPQLSGMLMKEETARVITFPHLANHVWWTGIVAFDPSAANSQLILHPYGNQGQVFDPITVFFNQGDNKYITIVNQEEIKDLPTETAWLSVEAEHPITGFELFGTLQGNQLAGYTAVNINKRSGIFPKLEKNGWTGIAFVNVGGEETSITLTAYDDAGTTVATAETLLAARAKTVRYARELFTTDISKATYIAFQSEKTDVVGFQLNSSSNKMMLDGLPGM